MGSFPYPRGANPSSHDPNDHDFGARRLRLAGAMPEVLTSIDTGARHVRRTQGQPSCVGYATWTAVQDLDLVHVELDHDVLVMQRDGSVTTQKRSTVFGGEPLPLLSGQWGYTGGRILGAKILKLKLDPLVGLPNDGSSKRLNIQWGRDVDNGGGARAETVWPDVPANATRLPPARVDQAEPLVKIGGYSRIKGEDDPDALERGIWKALNGFLAGECSKPSVLMPVGSTYGATREGEVYDDEKGSRDTDLGWHDQLVKSIRIEDRTVELHTTWPGVDTYRVRIAHLAAVRGESWVLNNLIYIPVAA